jgi:coenzyme F420-0:L-glutamate ligase/coenzyme F420-1:gamma-L-glutamate ligase
MRMGTDIYFWQVLTERRSVRDYRPEPLPPRLINRLLEAALLAPSAHNRQPWRFAVVTTPEVKEKLARAMGERLREDLAGDGLAPQEVAARVEGSLERLTGSPCLIVACLTMADMPVYADERRAQLERVMAVQSVAAALQNLLLAAQALGLGACWRCAPLYCPQVVVGALELPEDWEPQALITLGYPGNLGERKGREPLKTRVVYR